MIKKITHITLIVITVLFAGCTQVEVSNSTTLTKTIDSLNNESYNNLLYDFSLAQEQAEKAKQLSDLANYNEGAITSLSILASVNNHHGAYGDAKTLLDSAIVMASHHNLEELEANCQQLKGFVYFTESKYDSAYRYYLKALPYYQNIADSLSLGNLYTKIGRVYYNKRAYNQALEYYLRALDITSLQDDGKAIARDMNNIGSVYEIQGKMEEAMTYFREALQINKRDKRTAWIAINYHNIANVFSSVGEGDSAKRYFQKALEIDRKIGDKASIAYDLYSLGSHYQSADQHEAAIPHFLESVSLCNEINDITTLCSVSEELAASYEALGKHEEALFQYQIFHSLSDSIFNSSSSRRIIEMELGHQYELEKSNYQIKQQNKLLLILYFTGGLLLVALLMTILYTRSKLREKSNIIRQSRLQENLTRSESEIITNIVQLSEKNDFIEEILKKLKRFSIGIRKKDQEDLAKIIANIQDRNDSNVWQEFELRFKEIDGLFYDKLTKKHPGLTTNELRLCAFLKLNMSTKEIAAICHQSPASLNVARSRLRKKINLTHTDIDLNEYLRGL